MVKMPTLKGKNNNWFIGNKISEGDAGEIYLVRSADGSQEAILKLPYSSAPESIRARQVRQIKSEGEILEILNGTLIDNDTFSIRTPRLLDRNPIANENDNNIFIVTEKASGIDLQSLAKYIYYPDQLTENKIKANFSLDEQKNLSKIQRGNKLPPLIILRSIYTIILFLNHLHSKIPPKDNDIAGIVWNDVKFDHLFWDFSNKTFWVIDWGNSFIIPNDKKVNEIDSFFALDINQYLHELPSFLSTCQSFLLENIPWDRINSQNTSSSQKLAILQNTILPLLSIEESNLRQLRRQEQDLLSLSNIDKNNLKQIELTQDLIIQAGEFPNYNLVEEYLNRAILKQASAKNLQQIELLTKWHQNRYSPQIKWKIMMSLLSIIQNGFRDNSCSLSEAIKLLLRENYLDTLWLVTEYSIHHSSNLNLNNLVLLLQEAILGIDNLQPSPWILLNRLYLTMQAQDIANFEKQQVTTSPPNLKYTNNLHAEVSHNLLRDIKELSIKWQQPEPEPPGAGIDYPKMEDLLVEAEKFAPNQVAQFRKSLYQPKAHIDIILSSWEAKKFDTACKALKNYLVWDPDRKRVIKIHKLINNAKKWFDKLYKGPQKFEKLIEFITKNELEGRELLTRVAPSSWLENILNVFSQLRKGVRTQEILKEYSDILTIMPWLKDYETVEDISGLSTRLAELRPIQISVADFKSKQGNEISIPEDYQLTNILDLWIPEARGSSARVFGIRSNLHPDKITSEAAIKILRPGEEGYALPLFKEEAIILSTLQNAPYVIKAFELGLVQFQTTEFMSENWVNSLDLVKGKAIRYNLTQHKQFSKDLDLCSQLGWLPYIILEYKPPSINMMTLVDAGQVHGKLFSIRKGTIAAIQACEALEAAHHNNIVYRDHKILHYYWEDSKNALTIIDWNVARWHPEGLRQEDIDFDLVQFGARALHHIFTGRPAPGALPLGPNRLSEIDLAQQSYSVQWTYDDRRLPNELKSIISMVLSGNYHTARQLRTDLTRFYINTFDNNSTWD